MNTNDRRGGFYFINERPYVSVTTVIQALDKSAQLMYWFGREVYRAMVVNPNIDERTALNSPYKTRDKAAERGKTVHSIVESWKTTKTKIQNIPDPYKGYADAFYSWVNQNGVELLEQEKTVVSEKYSYAGQLDILAKVNNRLAVIDIKTNKDGRIYETYHLQISAYINALKENGVEINEGHVLVLSPEGTYNYGQITDCFDVFLKLKDVWSWQNRELCEKVGYDK